MSPGLWTIGQGQGQLNPTPAGHAWETGTGCTLTKGCSKNDDSANKTKVSKLLTVPDAELECRDWGGESGVGRLGWGDKGGEAGMGRLASVSPSSVRSQV